MLVKGDYFTPRERNYICQSAGCGIHKYKYEKCKNSDYMYSLHAYYELGILENMVLNYSPKNQKGKETKGKILEKINKFKESNNEIS
jgi:hypothetical protein